MTLAANASARTRAETAFAPIAAAALVVVALAVQIRFGMMADVSWLIEADEKWLAGGIPYKDILELNPPASLLIYLPAVALARVFGAQSELFVSAFGFAISGLAIALGAAILRTTRSAGPGLLLAAIFATTVLPGQTFCERDHLAAVFGLPLLALALARAEGARVPAPLAVLAGLGAGAMAAIKPPYALIGALLAAYQWRRAGLRAALLSPEYYAAVALALAYVASVGPLFPAYFDYVLPFNLDVYVAVREPLMKLIVSPGLLVCLTIAATATLSTAERAPGFVVAMLAAAGAGAAYLIQGKGWVYQAVPAMMFASLAAPFALTNAARAPIGLALAAAAVVTPALHSLGLGLAIGAGAGLAMQAGLARKLALTTPQLAPLWLAASLGAAAGLCTVERPLTPALEAHLARLGPGLKLATISEDEGLGFPLTRRLGDRWALRTHSLIVSAGARRLIDEHPGDASLARRLAPYLTRDRANLLQDLARERPDALLVGPLGTRLHAALFADPELTALMANYALAETEQGADYAAELWLRRDHVDKD